MGFLASGLFRLLRLPIPVTHGTRNRYRSHWNSGIVEHQYPVTAAGLLQRISTAFPRFGKTPSFLSNTIVAKIRVSTVRQEMRFPVHLRADHVTFRSGLGLALMEHGVLVCRYFLRVLHAGWYCLRDKSDYSRARVKRI